MIADCGNIFISTILTDKLKEAELAVASEDGDKSDERDSPSDSPRPEATQVTAKH